MNDTQKLVARFLKQRGWDQHATPASYAKSISIEAAELLEHFQWKELTTEELRKDREKFEEVKNELADVLIYAHDLASLLGVEVDAIIRRKLRAQARKYPVARVKGNDAAYREIKQEFRRRKAHKA